MNKQSIHRWAAFTLMELMVVVSVIGLITAMVLPSIMTMFAAGSDAQAANIITAQLSSARSYALRNNTYAGVLFAMEYEWANATAANTSQTITSIVARTANNKFGLAPGYSPIRLPGHIVCGQLTNPNRQPSSFLNVAGTGFNNDTSNMAFADAYMDDFVTFTVMFSPTGQLTRHVTSSDANAVAIDIVYNNTDVLLSGSGKVYYGDNASLGLRFNGPAYKGGVAALTIFDAARFKAIVGSEARVDFLNESGQYLTINAQTGQLFPRK